MQKLIHNYLSYSSFSWVSTLLSVLGHFLLFLCFILVKNSDVPRPIKWGNLASQAFVISFSDMTSSHAPSQQQIFKQTQQKTFIKQKVQTPRFNQFSHPLSQHKSNTSAENQASRGQTAAEIVKLLHKAIQKQQHYPENALEMEREGRVGLKFMLFTDGSIANLHITHSSGTTSLDQAALSAIRQAVPFRETRPYLKVPEEYSIDVVFELI